MGDFIGVSCCRPATAVDRMAEITKWTGCVQVSATSEIRALYRLTGSAPIPVIHAALAKTESRPSDLVGPTTEMGWESRLAASRYFGCQS